MIFNSVTFLLFLSIVVALYWVLPRRPRLWVLFFASLTFYGFWRVEFLPVMLASTVTDYAVARGIHASGDPRRRRALLLVSLGVNLGLLFYFKYLLFFAENVTGLLRFAGFDVAPPGFSIILPLGISFYTFQTISYTVDVYRGFIRPERHFVLYACYVTYFPQLVAGPILRAAEVIGQLDRRPPFAVSDFAIGLRRVLFGLFLKVVMADHLAGVVDRAYAQPVATLSAIDVWTMAFLFGFQIYFDFSAYSHIALGCARMMGIRFPENFSFPYFASSPRDFWRRWHISLSSWIRDYLYLPLAGETVRDRSTGGLVDTETPASPRRRNRALFLTWGIMGLWHGANWTFVLWGLHHAALVYAHRRIAPHLGGLAPVVRSVGGFAITLPLAMLGWIAFRASDLPTALRLYGKVVDPGQYLSRAPGVFGVLDPRNYLAMGLREDTYLGAAYAAVAMLVAWLSARALVPALQRHPAPWLLAQTVGIAVVALLVIVFLRPINQFIYFQF